MGKTRESVVNGVTLKVPQEFAGILPVGSSRNFDFEVHSHLGLKHSLREGDEALDVGCSYGVMSALMGNLVKRSGKVYSLEANADVIGMAELLLKENGVEPRVHNAAVGDREGEVQFHAVPGRQSVASTINPEILKVHPDSIQHKVKAVTIDGFCAEHGISPRCIKIDVEGAECAALRGARGTLKRCSPDLVIETHGLEILGVGGSLEELAGQLEEAGYRMLDMQTGELVSADGYARLYAGKIGTMLASARMSGQELERAGGEAKELAAKTPEPAPQVSGLDFTGERVVPGKVPAQLYNEHLARYAFAASMVKGRDVLDMGCGTGYGSQFLSEAGARSVLGIDSSKEAVEYARAHYAGARFSVADAARFETDEKFDVAVAFEAIEHTRDHDGFVGSAKRALKEGGILVISTPNRRENPPGYTNPFHEKELDEAEFRALLEERFGRVHVLYQSFAFGVAISADGQGRIDRALSPEMKKKYLIAVCGAGEPPRGAFFPAAFEHADYFAQITDDEDAAKLRGMVDRGKFGEAYAFASKRSGDGAEWCYLSAFAAHMTGRHRESIPLYGRALEAGFDAFWVHYNRGQALLSAGEAERGRKDLEEASSIDPANEDCKKILDGLG